MPHMMAEASRRLDTGMSLLELERQALREKSCANLNRVGPTTNSRTHTGTKKP